MRGLLGGGSAAQNSQGIAVGQVVERFQRCRVVLPQRATQGVGVPGAGPDQVLVPTSKDLDRLDLEAVTSQTAVVVPVGADQVSQYFGVTDIGFRSRNLVALAVAGHRQRVNRKHLIPRHTQRLHPQAAIGFDTDHHLAGLGDMVGYQLVEPSDAGQPFG